MTYYGPKELAASFRTVRNNTIQIAEDIPEEHYSYQATPETQTVAGTLVHLALNPRLQEQVHLVERRNTLVGFDFFAFRDRQAADAQAPRSKAEIVDLLRTEGEKFAKALEGLSDEFLAERVEFMPHMVPPDKTRFEMLLGVKEHEMHHRGQLMLVERLLGITPHLTRRMQEMVAAMKAAQSGG
jgi:uncharacterized damage-inducible protein DinB